MIIWFWAHARRQFVVRRTSAAFGAARHTKLTVQYGFFSVVTAFAPDTACDVVGDALNSVRHTDVVRWLFSFPAFTRVSLCRMLSAFSLL